MLCKIDVIYYGKLDGNQLWKVRFCGNSGRADYICWFCDARIFSKLVKAKTAGTTIRDSQWSNNLCTPNRYHVFEDPYLTTLVP